VETRSEGASKTDLLGEAAGYAVFDLRRRRIGLVIEMVDDPEGSGQRLAIRRDGVFLWRRRLLPLDAIESVNAERRLVVVAEEGEPDRAAASGEEGREPDGAAASEEATGDDLLRRIDAYTRPEGIANGEEHAHAPDGERSVQLSATIASERHLRFVSTSSGYRLREQDGEPPAVGTRISVNDLPDTLIVVKLGPSPYPDDPRVCAFLERDDPLASPAQVLRVAGVPAGRAATSDDT
jgi:hypothetical protein